MAKTAQPKIRKTNQTRKVSRTRTAGTALSRQNRLILFVVGFAVLGGGYAVLKSSAANDGTVGPLVYQSGSCYITGHTGNYERPIVSYKVLGSVTKKLYATSTKYYEAPSRISFAVKPFVTEKREYGDMHVTMSTRGKSTSVYHTKTLLLGYSCP